MKWAIFKEGPSDPSSFIKMITRTDHVISLCFTSFFESLYYSISDDYYILYSKDFIKNVVRLNIIKNRPI